MSVRALLLRFFPRLFGRLCVPDARELGLLGEEIAARALVSAGLEIRGRRLSAAGIEVDIWAREGDELVCVEVKTTRFEPGVVPRGSGLALLPARWRADGRLGSLQLRRLVRAARALRTGSHPRWRVDLVEVFLDARSGSARLRHTRGLVRSPETRSGIDPRGWNGSV